MKCDRVTLAGETITHLIEQRSRSEIRRTVSMDYQISDISLKLSLLDRGGSWYQRIKHADGPILLEAFNQDERLYVGQVEATACRWTPKTDVLRLLVKDLMAKFKTRALPSTGWNRPEISYRVLEGDEQERPVYELEFHAIPMLYPGDTLLRETTDPDSGEVTNTEPISVAYVVPESGLVRFAKPVEGPVSAGEVWRLGNNEPRYVPADRALDLIRETLSGTGLEVTGSIRDVIFPAPVAVPVPPPTLTEQPGSVILRCARDRRAAWAAYRTEGEQPDRLNMVALTPGQAPEWSTLNHSGALTAPYPMDWTRHRTEPPASPMPPLEFHQVQGGILIPRILRLEGSPMMPPQKTFITYDWNRGQAWKLVDPNENGYRLERYDWTGEDWALLEVVATLPGLRFVRGFAFDLAGDCLLAARLANGQIILDQIDRTGTRTEWLTGLEPIAIHSLDVIDTHGWIMTVSADGFRVNLLDLAGNSVVSLHSEYRLLHRTLTVWGNGLYAAGRAASGTHLIGWTVDPDGVWSFTVNEPLLDGPAFSTVITRTDEALWIGAHGRLWTYGVRYTPMLEHGNLDGMTVQTMLKNLLFLADGLLMVAPTGELSIMPRETIGDPVDISDLAGPPQYTIAWSGEAQAVTVKGANGIKEKVTTGREGQEKRIESKYVTSTSLARALARLAVSFRSPRREMLSVSVPDTDLSVLDFVVFEGRLWWILSIQESLTFGGHDVQKIQALEVF